jgi:riboflavin synthase alpha subunit
MFSGIIEEAATVTALKQDRATYISHGPARLLAR